MKSHDRRFFFLKKLTYEYIQESFGLQFFSNGWYCR